VTVKAPSEYELHPDGWIVDVRQFSRSCPELFCSLACTGGLDATESLARVNFQSGLLGVMQTSSDMQDLLDGEAWDVRMAEAVALFCHQVKKLVNPFASALGGLNTLMLACDIGGNTPAVCARICEWLGFRGIELEATRNPANEGMTSGQPVCGLRTDEGRRIDKPVCLVLNFGLIWRA